MDKASAIRKAGKINSEALVETIRRFRDFKTEKDISGFLNKQIKKRKAKLAFPTIIASGKNAFELHHKPTRSKIKKGFLLFDFGANVGGWCSDFSRTFFVGAPSKKEKQLYKIVRTAQERCIRMLKSGIITSNIDHAGVIGLGKYSPTLKHAIGHGVGRKVHDKPAIYSRACDVLKAGDVIAIEPGIYIKNKLGIRIEDTVLIKKNGHEVLTKFPKKLICLK
ncbi:MAG TPA: M24 family metallopeptidase [Nanoarchaeota archaeon]|nr:M24 family metallopeptidase [Nanoarchaeota archaeon]